MITVNLQSGDQLTVNESETKSTFTHSTVREMIIYPYIHTRITHGRANNEIGSLGWPHLLFHLIATYFP